MFCNTIFYNSTIVTSVSQFLLAQYALYINVPIMTVSLKHMTCNGLGVPLGGYTTDSTNPGPVNTTLTLDLQLIVEAAVMGVMNNSAITAIESSMAGMLSNISLMHVKPAMEILPVIHSPSTNSPTGEHQVQ